MRGSLTYTITSKKKISILDFSFNKQLSILCICQGRNSRGRRYKVIGRNHTPFWSNVQYRRGIYLAIIERRLR